MTQEVVVVVAAEVVVEEVDYMNKIAKKLYSYKVPAYIKQRFWRDHGQHLTKKEVDLVFDTLKDFMYLSLYGHVYLSSYIVDEAWHTFILFTKDYHKFCNEVFGKYFHHMPSISGGYKNDIKEIADTYLLMKEKLPKSKLFKIDKKLSIKGSNVKRIISLKKSKGKIVILLDKKKIGSFSISM